MTRTRAFVIAFLIAAISFPALAEDYWLKVPSYPLREGSMERYSCLMLKGGGRTGIEDHQWYRCGARHCFKQSAFTTNPRQTLQWEKELASLDKAPSLAKWLAVAICVQNAESGEVRLESSAVQPTIDRLQREIRKKFPELGWREAVRRYSKQ